LEGGHGLGIASWIAKTSRNYLKEKVTDGIETRGTQKELSNERTNDRIRPHFKPKGRKGVR